MSQEELEQLRIAHAELRSKWMKEWNEVERLSLSYKSLLQWGKRQRKMRENAEAERDALRRESKTEQEFTNKYIKRLHAAEAEIKRLRMGEKK